MTVTPDIRSGWQALTPANAGRVEAAVGVYESRSNSGTLRFGYAGALSRFGLRGELAAMAEAASPDVEFRSEVITTYLSRWSELLGRHLARHGALPPGNADHHPDHLGPVGPPNGKVPMISFDPTPEQQMLIDTVRRFVQNEILPLEAEPDPDASHLPDDDRVRLTARVEQMGLRAWDAPADVGGPGLDVVTQALLAIEMSQHRAGLYAPCYGVFGGAGLAHLYEASEQQKERYLYPTLRGERRGFFALSEPSGGSDPARAIQTTATRDGDEWVLNGTKLWISNADRADYGIVVARTGEGRDGITSFIVDTDSEGFELRRIVHTLRTASPATELGFDNVRVPDANRLGEVGEGFRLAARRLVRQRIPYAAGCLGVATAAHRMAVDYAKERSTFGKLLASHQGIQWMLVDNEVDLRTARLTILEAAANADAGADVRTDAAVAKLVASEAASRVVDRSIQVHGALGVAKDLPLERWYREMRIRRIGEGPSEVQRMIIARHLLGGHVSA